MSLPRRRRNPGSVLRAPSVLRERPWELTDEERERLEAKRDRVYLAWIHKHPCCECGSVRLVEAHHHTHGTLEPVFPSPTQEGVLVTAGRARGKAQKAHDHWAIPLCLRCHRQFHDCSGPFRKMDKEELRAWQSRKVLEFRALYLSTVKDSGEPGGPRPATAVASANSPGSSSQTSGEPAAGASTHEDGAAQGARGLDGKKCRSCGASIGWVEMGSGKFAPVDLPGRKMVAVFDGRGEIVTAYTSHFATCPDAERYRRRNPPRGY